MNFWQNNRNSPLFQISPSSLGSFLSSISNSLPHNGASGFYNQGNGAGAGNLG